MPGDKRRAGRNRSVRRAEVAIVDEGTGYTLEILLDYALQARAGQLSHALRHDMARIAVQWRRLVPESAAGRSALAP